MSNKHRLTDPQRDELLTLHMIGWPPKRIAEEFGITYSAVVYHTRNVKPYSRHKVLLLAA